MGTAATDREGVDGRGWLPLKCQPLSGPGEPPRRNFAMTRKVINVTKGKNSQGCKPVVVIVDGSVVYAAKSKREAWAFVAATGQGQIYRQCKMPWKVE